MLHSCIVGGTAAACGPTIKEEGRKQAQQPLATSPHRLSLTYKMSKYFFYVGYDDDLEVVVSSAIGCTIIGTGKNHLDISGIKNVEFSERKSGLRVVRVGKTVQHRWYSLANLPTVLNADI